MCFLDAVAIIICHYEAMLVAEGSAVHRPAQSFPVFWVQFRDMVSILSRDILYSFAYGTLVSIYRATIVARWLFDIRGLPGRRCLQSGCS